MNPKSPSLRRWRLLVVLGLVLGSVASIQPADAVAATAEPSESSDGAGGQPLLEEVASGEDALDLVGDQLPEAAARNDMSPAELEELLLADETAYLDTEGLLFYVDPPAEAVPGDDQTVPLAAPYPLDQTFLLHSKPGSSKTIYLDFDGHVVQSTAWQPNSGLSNPFVAEAFDTSGDPNDFSDAEREIIQSVWQRVAEDYAPFEVDVTTQDPGFDVINRSSSGDTVFGTRLLVTDTPATTLCLMNCGGVAYLGVFDHTGSAHAYYQPAWCFANSLGNSAKNIAECASHEVGHNVGLSHDGVSGGATYYAGHSPWAPIMGTGYNQPITQFSKGEYANPSTIEDDFVVMAGNQMVKRADDYPAGIGSSAVLSATRSGMIESSSDVDTFRYTALDSGTATFTAQPAPVGPNLDIRLELYSSDGTLLEVDAPPPARVSSSVASGLDATISHQVAAGHVYYLMLTGDSHLTGTNGYSKYGSIGQYQAQVVGPPLPNDDLATATKLSGASGTVRGANVGATSETGETTPGCANDTQVNSVWWSWTAPETGIVDVSTRGSDFDTILSVHTGASHSGLVMVPNGCNDNAVSPASNQSEVSVAVVAGQTYRLRVDGKGSASGAIVLRWGIDRPPVLNVSAPWSGGSYLGGQPIGFVASASDSWLGDLTTAIRWNSSRDGQIGSGGSTTRTDLSPGTHTIRASVTDGRRTVSSPPITIKVYPNTVGGSHGRFIDDDFHIFEDPIEWLAAKGITEGCNPPANDRFCPDQPVTRGQMAAFLVRAFDLPAFSGADRFRDDNGNVFEGAIERLAEAGITVGCNPPINDRFCPDQQVTRGQMAAFLVRAFDLPAFNGPDRFRDDDGNVFEGAIERLAQAGITVGCNPPANDRFCPRADVTRGQMATFLKRAFGE